jgi:hypothetical protein
MDDSIILNLLMYIGKKKKKKAYRRHRLNGLVFLVCFSKLLVIGILGFIVHYCGVSSWSLSWCSM